MISNNRYVFGESKRGIVPEGIIRFYLYSFPDTSKRKKKYIISKKTTVDKRKAHFIYHVNGINPRQLINIIKKYKSCR
jgi:hypothetical protein